MGFTVTLTITTSPSKSHFSHLPLTTLLECCFVFLGKIVSPVLVITVFARGGQGAVLLARQGRAGAGNWWSRLRRAEIRTENMCGPQNSDTHRHGHRDLVWRASAG